MHMRRNVKRFSTYASCSEGNMAEYFHDSTDGDGTNLGRGTVCWPRQGTRIKPHFPVKIDCPERVSPFMFAEGVDAA